MNADGTQAPTTQRQDMRVNAAFGRSDLMQENHFRFPRQSGLPLDYFRSRDRYAEKCVKALSVVAFLLLVAWCLLYPSVS